MSNRFYFNFYGSCLIDGIVTDITSNRIYNYFGLFYAFVLSSIFSLFFILLNHSSLNCVIHQNILNELVWFCLGIVTKMTVPLNIYKNEEVISSELHNIVAHPIYYKSDRSHFIFSLAQLPFPVIVKYPR